MKILFYLKKDRLSPRGGPLGVGYYYYQEMQKRNDTRIFFLESDADEVLHSKGRAITSHLPKWVNSFHRTLRGVINMKRMLETEPKKTNVPLNDYDIIFFHETTDLYKEKENLKTYKGIVLLQSHSPLPLWQEQTIDLPKIYFKMIPDLKMKFSKIDEYAFKRADYIVFPCQDAEEPYLDSWELYKKIHEEKQDHYRYIVTGIAPVVAIRSRKEILEELSIPDNSFVVSYAGRHNTVKGYDQLKEIGVRFLGSSPDNYVVVAGRLGPIKELSHQQWREIGWTKDPYSYISASDVFILPNRVTYFDLVLIEVLSLGKIALISRTGGNKFFEKAKVKGVFLYDTIEQALSILQMIKEMPEEERIRLGNENRKFFENHLTVASMYDQFSTIVDEIESNEK